MYLLLQEIAVVQPIIAFVSVKEQGTEQSE